MKSHKNEISQIHIALNYKRTQKNNTTFNLIT